MTSSTVVPVSQIPYAALVDAPASTYRYAVVDTVVGSVAVAFNSLGIAAIRHAGNDDADDADRALRSLLHDDVHRVDHLPREILGQLESALSGSGDRDAAERINVSDFQRDVLRKTAEIPRGQVRTYSWVAEQIGHPRAVRAVGTALARNPLPLIIPCHRVVRSDGRVGPYGCGGSAAKSALLNWEGVELQAGGETWRKAVTPSLAPHARAVTA